MCPERFGPAGDAATLQAQLRNVYWIGGGSGAGKSVIARRLAARHGLRRYATDDAMPGHAVWLLPTPDFRRAAFDSRGSLWEVAGKTSDPNRALRNLLERDRMFTERLGRETERLALRAIEVDATMTEEGLAELVGESFGL